MSDVRSDNGPETNSLAIVGMAAGIVSAFVSHNSVRQDELANLIATVHGSLRGVAATPTIEPVASVKDAGAEHKQSKAAIKNSVHEEFLISFLDNGRYKSLKRHIGKHGHTPESYRAMFGLPSDYPMVSPNYSRARSQLAKDMQLGNRRKIERDRQAIENMNKNDSRVEGSQVDEKVVPVQEAARLEHEADAVGTSAKPKRGRRKASAEKEAA